MFHTKEEAAEESKCNCHKKITIEVGKSAFIADWPSLRTGRADLPHPALRLMGPLQGLTRELMGLGQGIQA